jgi:hypothetical protein
MAWQKLMKGCCCFSTRGSSWNVKPLSADFWMRIFFVFVLVSFPKAVKIFCCEMSSEIGFHILWFIFTRNISEVLCKLLVKIHNSSYLRTFSRNNFCLTFYCSLIWVFFLAFIHLNSKQKAIEKENKTGWKPLC